MGPAANHEGTNLNLHFHQELTAQSLSTHDLTDEHRSCLKDLVERKDKLCHILNQVAPGHIPIRKRRSMEEDSVELCVEGRCKFHPCGYYSNGKCRIYLTSGYLKPSTTTPCPYPVRRPTQGPQSLFRLPLAEFTKCNVCMRPCPVLATTGNAPINRNTLLHRNP